MWRGIRSKTSGGLTKDMLIRNKRGKIVSKKKSGQASNQNNLGSWLREKGKKIAKADMLRKKGSPPDEPKKAAPKKAKAAPKPKAAAAKKKRKAKPKGNINPITQQPYEKKNKLGYVEGGKISLDNVKRTKRIRKKRVIHNVGSF